MVTVTVTVTVNNMKLLIVGLGNPGEQYERTRHNVGFIVIDKIAESMELVWKQEKKFKAFIASGDQVMLIKPTTFMNLSGEAVSKVASFYKIDPKNVVVVHDDVDFPFLEWKIQLGKDSAGHKGVEDIMQKLGTSDFWRVRVGVGKPESVQFGVEDYVLSSFTKEDLQKVEELSGEILNNIQKKFFQ